MAKQVFNVNTDAAIKLTAKLERLNKSAFPSAVRSTLNDAAFKMKQKEILDSAKDNMTVRNPTFFKRYTGVQKASGFNVNTMQSKVGFQDRGEKKAEKAVQGMESNEEGGIDEKGAMYLGKSRTSNSLKKKVRRSARFDKSKLAKGRVRSKKSVSNTMNLISSYEEKKPTFVNTKKGKFLVQVKGMKYNFATGKNEFQLDFLMRDRKKYKARAKATHFNRQAATKTSKMIDEFYYKNAEFQFKKVWR